MRLVWKRSLGNAPSLLTKQLQATRATGEGLSVAGEERQLTSYHEGLALQEECMRDCLERSIDSLIILEHQPVYTAGRRSAGFADSSQKLRSLGADLFDVRAQHHSHCQV